MVRAHGGPSGITAAPDAPPSLALGPQGLIRGILCDHLLRTAYIYRARLQGVATIFSAMLMNLGFKHRLQANQAPVR